MTKHLTTNALPMFVLATLCVVGCHSQISDPNLELDADTQTSWTDPPKATGLRHWSERVRLAIDRTALAHITLPQNTGIYVMRVVPGAGAPAYIAYEAGIGAFSQRAYENL